MKSILRLKHLRRLQEQAAEAVLIASQARAAQAAATLHALGQLELILREQALAAVLENDPESARWTTLELGAAHAAWPHAHRVACETERARQTKQAEYLQARRNQLTLDAWLQTEERKRRRLDERNGQKAMDEAYAIREHKAKLESDR